MKQTDMKDNQFFQNESFIKELSNNNFRHISNIYSAPYNG